MTLLHVGTSMADFTAHSSTSAYTTTSNLAAYVDEGIRLGGPASMRTPSFAGQSEIWLSFTIHPWDVNSNRTTVRFLNSDGDSVAIMASTSAGTHGWRLDLFTGPSSTTTVATGSTSLAEDSVYRFDIHLLIDDTVGVADIFIDGTSYATFSGDTNRITNSDITQISFETNTNSHDYDVSAVIVSTADTRAMEFLQRKPTADGAETDWSGDYTDIDENGFNDSDLISSSTDLDTSTFTGASLPSAVNTFDVVAVVVAARAQEGASATLRAAVRVGGTTYAPVDMEAESSANPAQGIITVNPATSAAWTFAAADAAEFGVRLSAT